MPRKALKDSQGFMGQPHFKNCWFNLRPNVNDKKKKKCTEKEP